MSQKLNSNEFTHSMKTKTTIQRQPNDKPWVLIMSTEETHEELCGDQANHKEAWDRLKSQTHQRSSWLKIL